MSAFSKRRSSGSTVCVLPRSSSGRPRRKAARAIGHINRVSGTKTKYHAGSFRCQVVDRTGVDTQLPLPRRRRVMRDVDCYRPAVLQAARRAAPHQSIASWLPGGARAGLMGGGADGRSMQSRNGLMTCGWVMVAICAIWAPQLPQARALMSRTRSMSSAQGRRRGLGSDSICSGRSTTRGRSRAFGARAP